MRKRIALIIVAALAALSIVSMAACGGESESGTGAQSPEPSATETDFATILGHAPTGVAKQIEDEGTITIATDANYPPQSFVDDSGEQVGFDQDVVRLVAEKLGVELDVVHPNFDSWPTGLKVGRLQVATSMGPTPERRETLDFSVPYYYEAGVVVTRVGEPTINSDEEMSGKTIGATVASTATAYLDEVDGVEVKTYAVDNDAFPDLLNGRLDGVMTYAAVATEAIASGKAMQMSETTYFTGPQCLAVNKGETDLVALLDHVLNGLREDGTLSELSLQWYRGVDVTVEVPEE